MLTYQIAFICINMAAATTTAIFLSIHFSCYYAILCFELSFRDCMRCLSVNLPIKINLKFNWHCPLKIPQRGSHILAQGIPRAKQSIPVPSIEIPEYFSFFFHISSLLYALLYCSVSSICETCFLKRAFSSCTSLTMALKLGSSYSFLKKGSIKIYL